MIPLLPQYPPGTKAHKLIRSILTQLEDLDLEDDEQNELLDTWLADVLPKTCEYMTHIYIPDHCNFWAHNYCAYCNTPEYPELHKLSHKDLSEATSGITEEQYKNIIKE